MPLATFAKVFFDTNIYLRILHSHAYERQHRSRFAGLAPQTYLCSVVAAELFAGAHTMRDMRLVERLLAPFLRVGRVVFPRHSDWIAMGKVVATLSRSLPNYRSKLPALQNDILIALSAKQSGATVVTENEADFTLIRRLISFSFSVLLPPTTPRSEKNE
jgi:predicted nucleic acid-binding protein